MNCAIASPRTAAAWVLLPLVLIACRGASAEELIPPLSQIKPDHPRLLVRPQPTRLAISLAQLRAIPRDGEFDQMLKQLQGQDNAAAQAMVWLLTQDAAAAEKAVRRMRAYRYPGNVDTFHIFDRLTEFGLAYDWLYNCPSLSKEIKAEIRTNVAPLARQAIRVSNDHLFHNYIWMSAGGLALWAMAVAGEDEPSNQLFEQLRQRFNDGLFPAWRYLDGLPSEPMGYWALYVLTPGIWTVLAAQSAFETDLVSAIRRQQDGWLDRHFDNLVHSALPDMRYLSWGDLQSGPNGGVTHEMAGVIDGATWALASTHGRQFGQWLGVKRGLARFHAETPIFYMLYTRRIGATPPTQPAWPALSFLAGNKQSAHFIARSGWDDGATVVALTCTDHFGDHHHYDQGSFLIYRRGLLAVDPPVYRQIRGPQQKTEHHNTLLIGGKPQRPVRGQWFATIEQFQRNLQAGPKLETGDMPFWHDAGPWTAAAAQFAQAYDCPELQSGVRQVLFIRPDKLVIVDRLVARPGKQLPEIQWLLQLPDAPLADAGGVTATNGTSWLRCRPVFPAAAAPSVEPTPVNTHRVTFTYPAKASITLVHLLEVGDGKAPGPTAPITAGETDVAVEVTIAGRTFVFAADAPYVVRARVAR